MAYPKLNTRSIRLFVATPEEVEKRRPNLNAPYFRVSRAAVEEILKLAGDGDPIISLGVWKRKGQDGKPDYFTAEVTYPETAEIMQRLRTKDDEWLKAHPRTAEDNKRRKEYAMNQRAAERIGVADADELPF